MDIRKIKKLIDLMIESDLQAIEVKEGDQSIALTRRNPVVAGVATMAAPVADAPVVKSVSRGAVEQARDLTFANALYNRNPILYPSMHR